MFFKNKYKRVRSRLLKLALLSSLNHHHLYALSNKEEEEEDEGDDEQSMHISSSFLPTHRKNTTPAGVCYLSRLPIDILYLIFENLSMADLLRFTSVSDQWHDFLVDWPEFWEKITSFFPDIKQSTLDTFIRRCYPRHASLESPSDHALLCTSILLLILSPNRRLIQKLSLHNIRIIPGENGGAPALLGYAITNMLSIKQIEFNNCSFTKHSELKTVLQSLSRHPITHLSFDYLNTTTTMPDPNIYSVYLPAKQDLPKTGFPHLTYLKLASPADFQIDNGRSLLGVFHQCPNLRHLFLDTFLLTLNGPRIIHEMLTCCPYLLDIVVIDQGQVPLTFTSTFTNNHIDLDNDSWAIHDHKHHKLERNKKKLTGQQHQQQILRRLILCSKKIKLGDHAHGDTLFKHAHATLTLLYLNCQLKGSSCHQAYYALTDLAWPKLREIHLSLQISSGDHISHQKTTMVRLANLFFRCPLLEVIYLDSLHVTGSHRLKVDDMVLKRIAENCTLIRRLHVLGEQAHSAEAMLYFAKTLGRKQQQQNKQHYYRLTDLEIDMARKPLMQVIQHLSSLKRLVLRNDTVTYLDSMLSTIFYNELEMAHQLLYERGGLLAVQ